jgi:hypothetical protein
VYQEARKLIHTQKIHKPVAVCLTKIDELETDFSDEPELYDWISIKTPGDNPYELCDLNEQEELSDKIKRRLQNWDNTIEPVSKSRFSLTNYFAIAPLGCRADSDGKLRNYSPIRVEDPFFWILNQLGLSKGEPEDGI